MTTQQLAAFATIFEPHPNSEYARQRARSRRLPSRRVRLNAKPPRHSPLPSASEIDAALQRKYGARRYGEI
jgi:hypothetical protein